MSTPKSRNNFVSNEDISVPLFKNKWLDKLTRTHISIPVSLFILYAIGLIIYTKYTTDLSNLQVVGLFFGGWFFFTFAEYMVHKNVYHMKPKSKLRKKITYTMHGIHHDYPKDKSRLAMPPVLSIFIGTLLLLVFELILDIYSFSFLAGFLVGYAGYLLVHYTVHVFHPPNNAFKALWTNHAIHHYQNQQVLFGVSSPLWDYILGTVPKEKNARKRVEVSGGV